MSRMILDEAAVARLLRMEELIPAVAAALADFSSGRAVMPGRVVVPVTDHGGFFGVMPAYAGALGAKLVTWFPNNQGVPTHHAVIQLFRPDTGEPLVTMDGTLITEMRTGAASAVATDLLARKESSTLAIIGSGVQARSHLAALRLVRQFSDVRVWSPRHADRFAARFGVRAVGSAEEAVRGADVIAVATMSRVPVVKGKWVSAGAHVNAVGAVRPDWRELDDELVTRARLFVESRDAALRESGDAIANGHVVAEIGELVAHTAAGRASDDEITLYKSVGIAVEDIAAASLVHARASAA
jgi:ornithine cyclodeaminase/alanine dehydrogenase-like protein (mu-crystallin family)